MYTFKTVNKSGKNIDISCKQIFLKFRKWNHKSSLNNEKIWKNIDLSDEQIFAIFGKIQDKARFSKIHTVVSLL